MKLHHLYNTHKLRPDVKYQHDMRKLNMRHLQANKNAWLSRQFSGNSSAPYRKVFA